MGIFDSIFGGEENKEKSTSTTTGTTTKEESADTASVKQTAGQTEASSTQEQTQTQQSFTFTPEQMNILDSLINRAAAKETIYGGETQDLATTAANVSQFLANQLQSQPNVDELVLNAKNAAKLDFEENIAPSLTQFAGAVGSEANTAVQMLRSKAGTDLATKLAGLETDVRLRSQLQNAQVGGITSASLAETLKGQQSVDLGGSQALQDALAALTTAKGGAVTTVGQGVTSGVSSQKTTESELSEQLVKALTEIQSTQTTKTKGKASSSGSALNLIDTLLSGFSGGYGTPA